MGPSIALKPAGDEINHTKHGNNNTYCQDNELSRLYWDLDSAAEKPHEFTRFLIRIRREHPVFRRRTFFRGRSMRDPDLKDVGWFRPDGKEMTQDDWVNFYAKSLGMLLTGDAIEELDERGNPIVDDTMLLLINAHYDKLSFVLSSVPRHEGHWELVLDTRTSTGRARQPTLLPDDAYELESRSIVLFRFNPVILGD